MPERLSRTRLSRSSIAPPHPRSVPKVEKLDRKSEGFANFARIKRTVYFFRGPEQNRRFVLFDRRKWTVDFVRQEVTVRRAAAIRSEGTSTPQRTLPTASGRTKRALPETFFLSSRSAARTFFSGIFFTRVGRPHSLCT